MLTSTLAFTLDGTLIADVGNAEIDKEDEWEANARRLVAAVNACAGIPTEDLEADVVRRMRESLAGLQLDHCATYCDPRDVEVDTAHTEECDEARAILKEVG